MTISFSKKNKNNVNNALEGKKSYKKLTPEEWHQFVQNYNYDDGVEPFEWLIKQQNFDNGTALCLYWLLEPDFYCNENNRNRLDENYNLMKEIEKRFLDGYYETELFSFDPKEEFLTSETDISCIPRIMQEKTRGLPFKRINVEFAYLRNPDEKELSTIDKKLTNAISIIQKTNPLFQRTSDVQQIISEIINCVEYWKDRERGNLKIQNLSFLWLDCLREKYNWTWIIWDWETGNSMGVANKNRTLTCLQDTIIKHTIDDFEPTTVISELFNDLNGIEKPLDMKQNPYSGTGLLFDTEHLKFRE